MPDNYQHEPLKLPANQFNRYTWALEKYAPTAQRWR